MNLDPEAWCIKNFFLNIIELLLYQSINRKHLSSLPNVVLTKADWAISNLRHNRDILCLWS